MSQAERKWLRHHLPPLEAQWNLLTDLNAEDLQHVF